MPTRGGPGQQATHKRDQGDAGHARYRHGDAGQFLTEQQPPNERWNNQQRQARLRLRPRRRGQAAISSRGSELKLVARLGEGFVHYLLLVGRQLFLTEVEGHPCP